MKDDKPMVVGIIETGSSSGILELLRRSLSHNPGVVIVDLETKKQPKFVNVGTVGHIDHGKSALIDLICTPLGGSDYTAISNPPAITNSYLNNLGMSKSKRGKGGKQQRKKLRGW